MPLHFEEDKACPQCNGDGLVSWMSYDGREHVETCLDCNGSGMVTVPSDDAGEEYKRDGYSY